MMVESFGSAGSGSSPKKAQPVIAVGAVRLAVANKNSCGLDSSLSTLGWK
jgi:hypothetical protein